MPGSQLFSRKYCHLANEEGLKLGYKIRRDYLYTFTKHVKGYNIIIREIFVTKLEDV